MYILKAVSIRLQKLIDEKDVSVNKVAKDCGYWASTVAGIINGRSKNPGILTLTTICESLGVTLQEFFNDPIFKNSDSEK